MDRKERDTERVPGRGGDGTLRGSWRAPGEEGILRESWRAPGRGGDPERVLEGPW